MHSPTTCCGYRLARFAAELEFDIDDEMVAICRQLPKHELLALPRDRVRTEFLKTLAAQRPDRFFSVLHVCDQLDVHFEDIAALANVPAGPPQHHGEGDALVHTCMVLREAAKLSSSVYVRFAALLHDLGKALTQPELLPRHHGHEDGGVIPIEVFCSRLGLGKDYRNVAVLASTEHLNVHRFRERRYVNIVDMDLAADRTMWKAEGLPVSPRLTRWGEHPDDEAMDLCCCGTLPGSSVASRCRRRLSVPNGWQSRLAR